MKIVLEPIAFVWDEGNIDKNVVAHGIANDQAEAVFFDPKKKIFKDTVHSGREERLRIIGKTKGKRLLFVVFTIRKGNIRIISARDINRKEVHLYEEKTRVAKI